MLILQSQTDFFLAGFLRNLILENIPFGRSLECWQTINDQLEN